MDPENWEMADLPPDAESPSEDFEDTPMDTPAPPLDAMPPLPDEARPPVCAELGARAWLDDYVAYARSVSPMTPDLFHEGAALVLASIAIARRVKLLLPHGPVYPNLQVLWLAPTTIFRKTTAMGVARDLARRVFPHLLAPQESTPEAMLADLAGRPPAYADEMSPAEQEAWRLERDFCAQRGLVLDEMSGLLASSGRDYNAGLLEALLRLTDCDGQYTRSTRGQGRVTVRHAYLTVLGASTPAAMAPHLAAEGLWSNGFWPRFCLLTPEGRPCWQEATADGEPPERLVEGLRRLYQRLPKPTYPDPPTEISAALAAETWETWRAYSKAVSFDLLTDDLDARLFGTYGRMPSQALKVATILACLDWPDDERVPRVELEHLARAISICECWRASAHRALATASQTQDSARMQRLLRQIGRHAPEGATLRELCRAMSDVKPADVQELVNQAEMAGYLTPTTIKPGVRGGRPTQRYRLAAA